MRDEFVRSEGDTICANQDCGRPSMVYFGRKWYGREFVCLRCGDIRSFGHGVISEIRRTTRGISGSICLQNESRRIPFCSEDWGVPGSISIGSVVPFEVKFLSNGKILAVGALGGHNRVQERKQRRPVNTFARYYGPVNELEANVPAAKPGMFGPEVQRIIVLLRDASSGVILLAACFPPGGAAEPMLYTPVEGTIPLEATLFVSAEGREFSHIGSPGQRYFHIRENMFSLKINRQLRMRGVIEHVDTTSGRGCIQLVRRGIPFESKWSVSRNLHRGEEVDFLLLIGRHGLEARFVRRTRNAT
ncbi:MAG: hypothetical protein GYA56_10870 [Geobacteraceae bacterium]|nr:hypothetical protein [Geobacteraceae bacterium]